MGVCLLNLLFLAGTLLWGDPLPLFGVSTIYRVVLGLGVLAGVLTIGALIYTARAHYTVATAAALAFVWFLNYWNLLGWRF